MANIDDLKYNFDQGARPNRYNVNFILPKSFGDGSAGRNMGLRVESCELPGRSIDTTSWSEFGAERQMPTGSIDDGGTTDMTFICTQDFADRLIIEAWQSLIYTADSTASNDDEGLGTICGTAINPRFAWYDDYIGSIEIHQLRSDHKGNSRRDDEKRIALKYTLNEAYPVSFDAMTLGYGEDGILKFKVTFAFRSWSSEYVPAPERSLLNKGRGLLDALLGGSNLLSRFGKEGKLRKTLTNLDTRTSQLQNLFGGGD